MVIVDDHLALLVLAAVPAADLDDDVATTSLWYLRLASAATARPSDAQGPGRLARTLASLAERDGRVAVVLECRCRSDRRAASGGSTGKSPARLDVMLNAMLAGDVEVATKHYQESDLPAA